MSDVATTPVSVFIIGTRAQLIKVAPVIVACERRGMPVRILLSGQHKETMQDLVAEFGIRSPQETAVTVAERSTVLSLAAWAPKAFFGLCSSLRAIAAEGRPLKVVVHGDTMSTVLGALAARRCGAPVYHVESGLTSGKLFDPFPEEISRRIVFRLADVALCPGPEATQLMGRYRCKSVDTGGNTIEDSVFLATFGLAPEQRSTERPYLVASLHRFQNIFDGERLRELVSLLRALSSSFRIHFVLHPATRKRLDSAGHLEELIQLDGLLLSPRLGYRDFLRLAAGAACVLTDGGSNQEELAVLGVPTIVMRKHTERADGLGANAVMEADVPGGLPAYLIEGRYAELRRAPQLRDSMGPSEQIADLLAS